MRTIRHTGEIAAGPWPHWRRPSGRAFTLVEMLVVITIILIALTMVLPSARKIWDERRIADTENTIRGLLMTTRARSLRTSGLESGLLFFLDSEGGQRILSIEEDGEGCLACQMACQNLPPPGVTDCVQSCRVAWVNVFRVVPDRQHRLPKPMRVVPRYAVESGSVETEETEVFSADELANNSFDDPPNGVNQAQRHRNYFTMVYSSDGRLLVGRDVLIRDDDLDSNNIGDLTGLPVGYDHSTHEANVTEYYGQDDQPTEIDETDHGQMAVPFLVAAGVGGDEIAVNFPSVDGLLAYDDSLFNNIASADEKREYLLTEAQPYYVSRLTGAVIRGPRGEATP